MSVFTRIAWKLFCRLNKKRIARPRPVEQMDISQVRKVLAVSSTAIGDTLFAIPAIQALKNHMPDTEIDLLARDKFIPLFKDIREIADFIPYKGGYRNTFTLLKKIKDKHYNLCLIFHDSDPCPAQAAWLAGIPFILRIGYKDEKVAHLLSARIPYSGREHAIEQRLELVRRVTGASLNTEQSRRMTLPVPDAEAEKYIQKICRRHGMERSGRIVIGLQPGASGNYKKWPLRNFAGLALKLLKYSDRALIFIMGSRDEARENRKLESSIKNAGIQPDRIINITGQVDIADLARLIKGMDLVITNDTGPLHIAIATATPTISLFVPTNADGTGPIQDLHIHTVIRKEKPCPDCIEKYCDNANCMSLITVDDVFRAAVKNMPSETDEKA